MTTIENIYPMSIDYDRLQELLDEGKTVDVEMTPRYSNRRLFKMERLKIGDRPRFGWYEVYEENNAILTIPPHKSLSELCETVDLAFIDPKMMNEKSPVSKVERTDMENEFFASCDCGSEVLRVSPIVINEDMNSLPDEFAVSILFPRSYKLPFLKRLRWAWGALFNNFPERDAVILSPRNARELSEFINHRTTPF